MGRRATTDGLGLGELADGERARFFAAGRDRALACLSATFTRHAYAPHTHDSYVLGTVTSGVEAFNVAGRPYVIGPGEVCFLEPGVVHDGRPVGDGFTYRITYPDAAVLAEIVADACERGAEAPYFGRPVVADVELAARLATAHAAAERDGPTLASDIGLHAAYVLAVARYAEAGGAVAAILERPAPLERAAVDRVLAYLDAHFAEDVDLERLAVAADLPRTRLIRAMRRQTGMTPHAWLTDRRVREAVRQLAAGAAPADVAAACGFCDQSHLNRSFRARIGVAPGAFRAARTSLLSKTGSVATG
jgi:AraC-like DNA-binding protein/mannose-6-phosphate isomerase-like protein (cupin superfamily)